MDEMVLSKAAAAPPQVFRPWRRFFARMLDWWLYGWLWFVFQLLVLNRNAANWSNTLWGLIIPFMINTYNMIILRTAFESIPESLIEAAQIDGAGHFKILMQIVIPLSKAMLAVMVLGKVTGKKDKEE